jgi:spore coat polysaccharide biosynthesis protein SpsF
MGSSRLPGKALLPLGGLPMIRFLLRRIRGSALAADLVLATTERTEDDGLAEEARAEGVRVFRGACEDVVQRYDAVAHALEAEYVVRVTGDCPFTDRETLDHCLAACRTFGAFDLASTKGAFPVGIDYEIYRAATLRQMRGAGVLSAADREHVTRYFYEHPSEFIVKRLEPREEWRTVARAFTVDTPEDYRAATRLADSFGGTAFSVADLVRRSGSIA